MSLLSTVVVVDYQNVHLTAYDLFGGDRPPHEALVDPVLYADQLIRARNQAQRPGYTHAVLSKVLVFRGLPSAEHEAKSYARNLAQQAQWERDRRVQVTHRPLKYDFVRDDVGDILIDFNGRRVFTGKKEKGVDVLCSLAVVREAADPAVDLVVLASTDTDLEPALDEALQAGKAKLETTCWYEPTRSRRCRQIRPTDPERKLWNTRLGRPEFELSRDLTDYR
jgi:hypothetical protein